jgi:hypothetical protein
MGKDSLADDGSGLLFLKAYYYCEVFHKKVRF